MIEQIRFDSYALGDNIAWIPYVEEYRKITGKIVLVSTFFNELFYKEYPKLSFSNPNNLIKNTNDVIYIGVEVNGLKSQYALKDWRNKPLQQVPCELLKIPYKPIQPKVSVADIEIPFKDYITISEHTTRKNKYWHNPTGWQEVVDYCTLKGVKVVVCSKEPTTLRGIIDCTGDRPLLNRAKLIQQSKLFIGVSSGLYWLAQATNTPSILISGSTEEMHEYVWKGIRVVTPKSYCSGCINNRLDIPFNDSFDCPSNKNYECSKEISSKQVIIAIKSILGENI